MVSRIGTRTGSRGRNAAVGLFGFAALAVAACASTGETTTPPSTDVSPPAATSIPDAAVARADSVRHSSTPADVAFMRGMIHHHAQALVMSRMAPSHGASERLQVLAARIINAQNDEIALMRAWLRDHGETAPHVAPDGSMEGHAPMTHMMPGMLSAEQMAELDAARGYDFDVLFLRYMIQHHEGALTMVEDLLATYGAAQNDTVFKLASDIGADQASEIERMRIMLHGMVFGSADQP